MQEETLIRLLRQQNENALRDVIRQYSAYVSTVIRNVGRGTFNESDVEEMAADVFAAVWQNADKLNGKRLRPYLGVLARNQAIDCLRRMHFTVPLDEVTLTSGSDIAAETEQKMLSEAVRSVIGGMAENDRDILLRFYFFCEHIPQIAASLQLSETAAKTRLFRARKKLLAELRERGYCYENESV
ncbi:MAG: sigma-70 family RNA polymerase sigma factor [Oscillospiraceae bacterium]|nr:sigma-70 family RNA polymerase sigma factor [Oscillospiraceae bacterium]